MEIHLTLALLEYYMLPDKTFRESHPLERTVGWLLVFRPYRPPRDV